MSKDKRLVSRFERKVDRSGGAAACWPWTAARTRCGYGVLAVRGEWDRTRRQSRTQQAYAHRLAYESARGPIPDGLYVLHRCDNPPCCNPAHLFLGTHADNMRDAAAKGRFSRRPRAG